MKITEIQNSNKTTFKSGLTHAFILKANRLSCDNAKALLYKNGLKLVDFQGVQSVAASCLAVVEIMKSFGFTLPKAFSYEPLDKKVVGQYIFPDNIIVINSNYKSFEKLRSQDRFQENNTNSPVTKHFLHAYIHEFLHAAHINNLSRYYSQKDTLSIITSLQNYIPKEVLLNPEVTNKTWNKWVENSNGSIICSYSKESLLEFFAETIAFEIENYLENDNSILGKNKGLNMFFNPKNSTKFSLSFMNNKKEHFWNKIFKKNIIIRNEIIKAIWRGDINIIIKKYSKYIQKVESTENLKLNLNV